MTSTVRPSSGKLTTPTDMPETAPRLSATTASPQRYDSRTSGPERRLTSKSNHIEGRTNMIEIDGLTKRYGDKTAVDRLSFVVEPGMVTGFLGPNGAGKPVTELRLSLPVGNGGYVRGAGQKGNKLHGWYTSGPWRVDGRSMTCGIPMLRSGWRE